MEGVSFMANQKEIESALQLHLQNQPKNIDKKLKISSKKKGVKTGKITRGAFKKGNTPWNKGVQCSKGGNTRRQMSKYMTDAERRVYFGQIEQHTDETRQQMSESAQMRWQTDPKRRRPVCAGVAYNSMAEAAQALEMRQDTIAYRCNSKSARFQDWSYQQSEALSQKAR